MLRVAPTPSSDVALAQIESYSAQRNLGDDLLRIWGLKFVMDGGVEGGALDEPYQNDPSFRGHLNWDPEVMTSAVSAALDRRLKVGTHCVGDRAVRTVLDVYEQASRGRSVPPNTLVLEHAFLADQGERARAVRLGVHVTVQPPLLHALAAQLMVFWGADRTRAVMPVKDWLAEGATLSAGSDYPIASFNPMESMWGFITRQTARDGVQGPEQAIDAYSAVTLYTVGGAILDGEAGERGTLEVGRLADLVAFHSDPFTCSADELRALKPTFVVVGGRPVHDPATDWER
jgi:predicted amidohydrolase YtcJ